MAIERTDLVSVVLKQAKANRFEIPMYRVENRKSGVVLTVSLNAMTRMVTDAGTADVNLVNLDDVPYEGERLNAIMADAAERFAAAIAAGASGPDAYYAATRDALYAALQADGHIPA